MIEVPPAVRAKAQVGGAQRWLDELPALVSTLEREWSLTVGRVYGDATEAFVAEAVRADGAPAVLKLVVGTGNSHHARNEITVLRLADGQGCARLLRADDERGALLLERLGPSLYDLGLPVRRQHEILCAVARRVWRPAPDVGLPTGADKGRWLAGYITATWESLGRPCAERTVAYALSCLERRIAAHNDDRALLLHGDVHAWNALQAPSHAQVRGGAGSAPSHAQVRGGAGSAGGGEFKLVDPDGLLAEPEYDLGVIMREDPVELMAGDPYRRAAWLADRTGLSAPAIWEWGVAERVSTGLLLTRIDLQPIGRQMLDAADRIAERYP